MLILLKLATLSQRFTGFILHERMDVKQSRPNGIDYLFFVAPSYLGPCDRRAVNVQWQLILYFYTSLWRNRLWKMAQGFVGSHWGECCWNNRWKWLHRLTGKHSLTHAFFFAKPQHFVYIYNLKHVKTM